MQTPRERLPLHEVIGVLADGRRFNPKPGESAGDLVARVQLATGMVRAVLIFGRRGTRE